MSFGCEHQSGDSRRSKISNTLYDWLKPLSVKEASCAALQSYGILGTLRIRLGEGGGAREEEGSLVHALRNTLIAVST